MTVGLFALPAAAQAARERCAAEVRIGAVGVHDKYVYGPSREFGFQLSARKERIVSGQVVFDTDHGWFVAPFRDVHIGPVQHHYAWAYGDYAEASWESAPMYVDMPSTVTVNHYFIDALATPDTTAPATPRCYNAYDPKSYAAIAARDAHLRTTVPQRNLLDEVDLTQPPPSSAAMIVAKASPALASPACATPFEDATAVVAQYPNFPMRAVEMGVVSGAAFVDVYLDERGNVADAWIEHSSGLFEFDTSVLRAAQLSSFKPAIAYCTPIPSVYIFRGDFDQRS